MMPLLSAVLAAKDVVRQQVYQTLLGDPDRYWTVTEMAARLPGVPVNTLRITLHLLLGDRLMDVGSVARQRSLALRLTEDGKQILAGILRVWTAGERAKR